MKLWQKVLIGIALGALAGKLLYQYPSFLNTADVIGQMFMRLIKMLRAPIIFCILCSGILNISDIRTFGYVGLKIVGLSLLNTFFAVTFGIAIALLTYPGKNFNISLLQSGANKALTSNTFQIKDFISNLIPENIFLSFAEDKLMQIVFFALFFGVMCQLYRKHYYIIKNRVEIASNILFYMMEKIINLSPYGAFCLIAYMVGTQGMDIIFALGRLIYAKCIAMFLQYLVFGLLILCFCKRSPMPFYKKSLGYQVLALSLSSSKLALPKTIQICKDSLGMSDFATKVALPIATTFNMTGSGIELGISSIFFAQIYNIDLTLTNYFYIIFLSTIGAIGCSGAPGLSLVMLPLVLQAINVPPESIFILIGVDRILDMLRTTINITGDVATAIVIDDSEKKLDYAKYYS